MRFDVALELLSGCPPGNAVVSPEGLLRSLEPLRQGARGATRAELDALLGDGPGASVQGLVVTTSQRWLEDGLLIESQVDLRAEWSMRFDPTQTALAEFEGSGEVPTMHQYNAQSMAVLPEGKLLELNYKNGLSMLIWLGQSPEAPVLTRAMSQMEYNNVRVSLPRFRLETEADLTTRLPELGVRSCLEPRRAELSPSGLYLRRSQQKVELEVDEYGSRGRASTLEFCGLIGDRDEFKADRPFWVFVVDKPAVRVLFAGRVVRP